MFDFKNYGIKSRDKHKCKITTLYARTRSPILNHDTWSFITFAETSCVFYF